MVGVVKLQLESGSQFFCLKWKERKLKGVSHGHRFPGVPWFNPGSASTFVELSVVSSGRLAASDSLDPGRSHL